MRVEFDPTLFSLGPLEVRWYGLMYVVGFLIGSKLALHLAKKKFLQLEPEKIDLYVFHLIIGLFLGARLFYVFIYNWDYYSSNMNEIFSVWKGGLSFHGGAFGFGVVTLWYSKKYKLPFFHFGDTIVLCATQGLFWGRIGNFINGELYGRITQVPWGMVFPNGGPYPRHPSQLYEGLGEGLLLFILLWVLKGRVKFHGILSGLFILGYGIIRFSIEFVREPDPQLGLYFGDLFSMGQILCFIMMIIGLSVLSYSYKKKIPIQSLN